MTFAIGQELVERNRRCKVVQITSVEEMAEKDGPTSTMGYYARDLARRGFAGRLVVQYPKGGLGWAYYTADGRRTTIARV